MFKQKLIAIKKYNFSVLLSVKGTKKHSLAKFGFGHFLKAQSLNML